MTGEDVFMVRGGLGGVFGGMGYASEWPREGCQNIGGNPRIR